MKALRSRVVGSRGSLFSENEWKRKAINPHPSAALPASPNLGRRGARHLSRDRERSTRSGGSGLIALPERNQWLRELRCSLGEALTRIVLQQSPILDHQSSISRAIRESLFPGNEWKRNAINPHPSAALPATPNLGRSGALASELVRDKNNTKLPTTCNNYELQCYFLGCLRL
jgi:hypothetical protein